MNPLKMTSLIQDYVAGRLCRIYKTRLIQRKPSPCLSLLKRGFMDPDIIRDVVPTIMVTLKPSIEEAIRHTMETTLVDTISSAIEKSLSKYKTDVIQPLLDKKDAEINSLNWVKTNLKESQGTWIKGTQMITGSKWSRTVWTASKPSLKQCALARCNQMWRNCSQYTEWGPTSWGRSTYTKWHR